MAVSDGHVGRRRAPACRRHRDRGRGDRRAIPGAEPNDESVETSACVHDRIYSGRCGRVVSRSEESRTQQDHEHGWHSEPINESVEHRSSGDAHSPRSRTRDRRAVQRSVEHAVSLVGARTEASRRLPARSVGLECRRCSTPALMSSSPAWVPGAVREEFSGTPPPCCAPKSSMSRPAPTCLHDGATRRARHVDARARRCRAGPSTCVDVVRERRGAEVDVEPANAELVVRLRISARRRRAGSCVIARCRSAEGNVDC